MSACPSSPIALLVERSDAVPEVVDLAADGPAAADLLVALSVVSDPRKSRGVRHRLLTVLAAAVCAVLAGARSYVVFYRHRSVSWPRRRQRRAGGHG